MTSNFDHADRMATLLICQDGFHIFGRTIVTPEELVAALREREIEFIEISTDNSQDYDQIGRAIYASSRSGAKVKWVPRAS